MTELKMNDDLDYKPNRRFEPSNKPNYATIKADENKHEVKAVAQGSAVKKKSLKRKISERFSDVDTNMNFKESIWDDIIVNGAKNLVYDAVNNGLDTVGEFIKSLVDIAMFGERRPRKGNNKKGYTDYSRGKSTKKSSSSQKQIRDYDDITFRSRVEARDVLDELQSQIDEYGYATIADYYQASGMDSGSIIDEAYGWDDIKNAYIARDRDGDYFINLPKARQVN